MLDPRIGRWLSIDPLAAKYPGMSPYVSMNNNPVTTNDVTGTEGTDWIKRAGSQNYEFDSQVQSQADATYRYGEGTSYLDCDKTFPGLDGISSISVGDVTVHEGGLMTWGNGKKFTVSDNAVGFPIDGGYGLPNDKPSDWAAGARIPLGNNPSLGSEGKGVFYTDLSSPYLESWMNERAKSDAISKFVIGFGAVGIAAPFVVGGAIVTAPVWAPAVVQGARLVGQGAKFYHNTFGKTGGYGNMGYNYYFQSSASGDWGMGSKDLFALGAQGFMKANTPIWQQSLVGASGALVQYTPNGGLTTMKDFSVGYNIGTAMNGALIPIVGNTKYANSLTSNFMFAGSQGVMNGIENSK